MNLKAYFILIASILFCSCEKEDDDLPYYRFKAGDEAWFTNYQEGDTITFVSDKAPFRKYVLEKIYFEKNHGHDGGWRPTTKYYYDRRRLEFRRVDNNTPYKSSGMYFIDMYRIPPFEEEPQKNLKNGKLILSVDFDDYNGQTPYDLVDHSLVFPDLDKPVTFKSISVNGKTYERTLHFKSNNPDKYCANCGNFSHDWRVNEIFYDQQFGVIKFSNIDSVVWEIK